MPKEDFIDTIEAATVDIALKPVLNILYSLILLNKEMKYLSCTDEWIIHTSHSLTPEEKKNNNFIINAFYYALLPEQNWPSFPSYLQYMSACDPAELRNNMLRAYCKRPYVLKGELDKYDENSCSMIFAEALESKEKYLGFLNNIYPDSPIDEELESEAYVYVADPPKMRDFIVSHLTLMWEKYFAEEWSRIAPKLKDVRNTCRKIDISGMQRTEAVKFFTGLELNSEIELTILRSVKHLFFIPATHIGKNLAKMWMDDVFCVFFEPDRFRERQGKYFYRDPDDIASKISAFSDVNRLKILKLIAEKGELLSKEIMEELNFSQSTISRHLQQLSAAGFLSERRSISAKCYTLRQDKIQAALNSVSEYLSFKPGH